MYLLSSHLEPKVLSNIYILSNSDLDIWPLGTIFNPTLGYPFSYLCTNFNTNSSIQTEVIIMKRPWTYRWTGGWTILIVPSVFSPAWELIMISVLLYTCANMILVLATSRGVASPPDIHPVKINQSNTCIIILT